MFASIKRHLFLVFVLLGSIEMRAQAPDAMKKEIDDLLRKNSNLLLWLISVVSAFVLLSAFLIYNRYRLKQKTSDELERLSIVASETDNVVLILSPEGEVEWANESFNRLNGITIEELKRQKGNTIFEISNNPAIKDAVRQAIEEKRSVFYEALNLNVKNRTVWESTTLTPIFNKDGLLKKLVIIDTDVTARKEAEELVNQKNKDITDSIRYAGKIQRSLLPSEKMIDRELKKQNPST
jgi:PAS domain S-box-containing protein